MPFTLSHAAAALPFRRTRLIPSALVVGTLAPDFEYFLRGIPGGHFGHTLPGVFISDLPLSLIVLWLFHAYMREPIVALLPDSIGRRLSHAPQTFRFWGSARLALIVTSILVGVGTHILWDSFTHRTFWPYRHWAFLREMVSLPILGTLPYYKVFQFGSSVAGGAILLIWFMHWYRTTAPNELPLANTLSSQKKLAVVVSMLVIAVSGALLRAKLAPKPSLHAFGVFLLDVLVTALSLIWMELLVYGIVWMRRDQSRQPV